MKMVSLVAFDIARRLGVKLVRLHVDIDNTRAINLYTRLGFKIKKRVYKGDYRHIIREYVDYYIMEKPRVSIVALKNIVMNSLYVIDE